MEIDGEPIEPTSEQIQHDPNAATMDTSFMGKSTYYYSKLCTRSQLPVFHTLQQVRQQMCMLLFFGIVTAPRCLILKLELLPPAIFDLQHNVFTELVTNDFIIFSQLLLATIGILQNKQIPLQIFSMRIQVFIKMKIFQVLVSTVQNNNQCKFWEISIPVLLLGSCHAQNCSRCRALILCLIF